MTPSETRTLARIVRRRVAAHAMGLAAVVILAGCLSPPLLLAGLALPSMLRRKRRLLVQREGVGLLLATLLNHA